jgi:hypothetical protein
MRSLLDLGLGASLILAFAACTLDLDGDDDGDGDGSGRVCGGFTAQPCDSDEYCDYPTNDCGMADGSGTCRARPTACDTVFDPVRGSNGEIYGNACSAHADGVDDCGPAPQR